VTPSDQAEIHRLALAVEQMNGTVSTGFATVRGDINVLATRESHNATAVTALRSEVDELKTRRFPVPMVGGLCGVAAVILSGIQAIGKG
jgi:hypothetical protein